MIQSFLFIIETENAKYFLSKILLQLRHPRTHVLSSDLDTSTPDFESKQAYKEGVSNTRKASKLKSSSYIHSPGATNRLF